jgi:hypothetical protein
MPVESTIGEFLAGILPRLQHDTSFRWWPPDCFAVCLTLLKQTGAYTELLQDWPPDRGKDDALMRWASSVRELGQKWRAALRLGQGPSFNSLPQE